MNLKITLLRLLPHLPGVNELRSAARSYRISSVHDDVIKWKHFPRYWPFVRGIHRSTVNSSHKGQWRGALMFSLICAWIKVWVNNREAGGLRRYRAHYDVNVMHSECLTSKNDGIWNHYLVASKMCLRLLWWPPTKFTMCTDLQVSCPYSCMMFIVFCWE